jgi:hypothetical protein
MTTAQGKMIESRHRAATQGNDAGGFLGEYQRKFAGLSGNERQWAVEYERKRLLAEDTRTGAGMGKPSVLGALWKSINPFSDKYPGWDRLTENEQRRTAIAQAVGEKPGGAAHRGNALVGGDFGEIGSGFYSAATELARTGYSKMEGADKSKDSTTILQEIFDLLEGAISGGGAGEPQPNKQQEQIAHAIPRFG